MGTLNDEWCHYSGMPSPNAYKLSLRDCFNEDFSDWLETSNYIGDHDLVPGDSLHVDKEKIKSYLRELKIDNILN